MEIFQNFVYGNVVYAPEKVYRATLSCLFPLDVQNEIQLLSRLFCNSWLVCLLCFLLTNAPLVKVIGNPISDGIVFKNELTHLPLLEA